MTALSIDFGWCLLVAASTIAGGVSGFCFFRRQFPPLLDQRGPAECLTVVWGHVLVCGYPGVSTWRNEATAGAQCVCGAARRGRRTWWGAVRPGCQTMQYVVLAEAASALERGDRADGPDAASSRGPRSSGLAVVGMGREPSSVPVAHVPHTMCLQPLQLPRHVFLYTAHCSTATFAW